MVVPKQWITIPRLDGSLATFLMVWMKRGFVQLYTIFVRQVTAQPPDLHIQHRYGCMIKVKRGKQFLKCVTATLRLLPSNLQYESKTSMHNWWGPSSNMLFFLSFLMYRAKDSVKHFHVHRKSSGYAFGFNKFPSLQDFVSHFANEPLLGSESG